MYSKELIKFALTLSDKAVMSAIDKAVDVSTVFPTPTGGCHPLWVLGHLTMIEGTVPAILYGEENPVAHWKHLFGEGSEPVPNANAYPTFTQIRERYSEFRERTLSILDSLREEDLDRPTKAPPKGREREFATFGSSLLVIALHQCIHRAHVMDALRAAGRVEVPVAAAN